MAKKAELEQKHETYELIFKEISNALQLREYFIAVKKAELALQFQHASINFQRRFQKNFSVSATAVDIILRYAPVFFLSDSIDAVEKWYRSGNKFERDAFPDFLETLLSARKLLSHAVMLWEILSESPVAVLQPPNDAQNKFIIPIWISASVVAINPKEPTSYIRVTDLRRDAVAKCYSCGRERRAPIADLLETTRCPACERRSTFAILRRII